MEQPSPEKTLRSSHVSTASRIPLPQTDTWEDAQRKHGAAFIGTHVRPARAQRSPPRSAHSFPAQESSEENEKAENEKEEEEPSSSTQVKQGKTPTGAQKRFSAAQKSVPPVKHSLPVQRPSVTEEEEPKLRAEKINPEQRKHGKLFVRRHD